MKIRFSNAVEQALKKNVPIVALESTIISHGMPYPTNIETAQKCESAVVSNGAVPATIGVIEGDIVVGLSPKEIETLANPKNNPLKIASKDLAFALATKRNGGTTVSATMFIAAQVGISVFATGGIGGVHRGVENTMDISSDLQEFTQSAVAVVSAGCKAILDIPRTLEYLETLGVPVMGFECDNFPAFYSRESGEKLALKNASIKDIATSYKIDRALKRKNGILVANPIPSTSEIPMNEVMVWINEALADLQKNNITGKEVTPFLLERLGAKSQNRTLASNIALVINNCNVAARLAVELTKTEVFLLRDAP
jgi:pseudouridine-5'-phosphate glycosidase